VISQVKADSPDAVAVMGHEKIKAEVQIDIVRFQEVAEAPAQAQ
jgi:hypothetical protein